MQHRVMYVCELFQESDDPGHVKKLPALSRSSEVP
jgi:hypothetical protein